MNLLKKLRPALSLILLFMALAAGIYYLSSHRNLLRQLGHTHLSVLIAVFGLYVVMFGVLVLILSASLKLCARRLAPKENAKLNVYSLLLNFFVPGQSGPAYRGAYLYKRHNLRVKSYIGITLIYFLFYALISLFLLLLTRFAWWQTVLALVIMAGLGLLVIRRYSARTKFLQASLSLTPMNVMLLFLATVLQAIVQVTIYAVELHSVNHHIYLSQIITYTGAANLALFVSLTPGAIGIRESFLIFTEHLHHISSANIILANVIDRSVYLIFLLILVVLVSIWQIKNKWDSKHATAAV